MSDENNLSVFDEMATRHNAALAAFRTMHEAKFPLPIKAVVSRDMVSLIIVVVLGIVMVAAVLVSGSRTIDEFGGGNIGAVAFVMIEGGIMAYAFFRARRNASKTRLQNTLRWATAGLVLTFIVGLGANADSTLRAKGIVLPDWVSIAIDLLVAVSAPTLAFISSDILAIELMAVDIKRRDNDDIYQREMTEWLTGLNAAWAREKSKWGVNIKIERPSEQTDKRLLSDVSVLSVSDQTDSRQTARSGYGHTRTPDGQTKVIEYLMQFPQHAELSSRDLAKLVGVGHDTANKGRNAWRGQQTQ